MLTLFYPACYLSYGETPLVNCRPRSILLHCYYHLPFTCFIYILANYYLLPLDTLNPLFTANQWDWQPHCKLGQSTWLCCVQVPHCCCCKATPWTRRRTYIVRSCRKASKHQPSEVGSFSYWFDKPWFYTEGRLAVVLIITFSWGFQLGGHLQNSYINTAPSTSSNVEPAHNTTKVLYPNLQWGCQSHRFAVNKGLNVSCGKR
jgi:hypothetical protein